MDELNTNARGWPGPLRALNHRNFRLFWFGQFVSLVGTWMQNIAQGWLVLKLTDSAFLLGLLTAAQYLPLLLFSLVAGVAADRFPKRNLLILTQFAMMILALVLGLLTLFEQVRYWHVFILAILLGIANVFDLPTRQSFVIEMVGKEDLMNAIALNSTIFNGARIIGPAVAGILIGSFGLSACFLFNSASYLAVLSSLFMIDIRGVSHKAIEGGVWEKIKEGLNFIRRTPVLFYTIILSGLIYIFAVNYNVLIPVFARNTLGLEADGFGFLMSAMGIGALGGAIFLATISRGGPSAAIMRTGILLLCLSQIALGMIHIPYLAAMFMVVSGFSLIIFLASVNTILQVNVPDHLRGRIMGVYSLSSQGTIPLGSLLSGSIAHVSGAPGGLMAGGGLGLASMALILFLMRLRRGKDQAGR